MTRACCWLVTVIGLLWTGSAWTAEKVTAPDSLEGTWKLTSVELNGQVLSMERLQAARLVVKGSAYTFTFEETKLEFTHALFSDKQPKAMDMTLIAGPDKGKTLHAIYKLAADTLTICRQFQPDKERPTEFGTKPDSGLILIVWTRAKTP